MLNQTNNTREKIRGLDELAEQVRSGQNAGQKVSHCHGVFDLLHIGHIRHLEQAKRLGDLLVVTITPDEYVNKGPNRPVFTQELRAEALAALECVDYVAVNRWPLAVDTIKLLRPDFYVKGSEYEDAAKDHTGGIDLEKAAVTSTGGTLAFTDDITFSSSSLINRHLGVLPEGAIEYLADFSGRYTPDQVIRYLDDARPLKVLLVGETIIDEYSYCDPLGKSSKEPVIAARHIESEFFAGGIVAITNHVASICDNVGMLTFLGGTDSREEFVREKVNPKVDCNFLFMNENAPTIVKKRFVEAFPFQKLFELYVMDDGRHKPAESDALCRKLEQVLPDYDVVVVADYGHGMLGPEATELLISKARFLALNTQANAGNRGFNTVSKYRRADLICVSEPEMRLEARSRERDIREIVAQVSDQLSCGRIIITQGQDGSLCYGKDEGFVQIPAFTRNVVDRIGAGDAVFSMAALCAAQGAPMEIVGFIGNAVGAEAVAIVGHRESTSRVPLIRHIETLMK